MRRNEFQKAWMLVTAFVVGAFGPVFTLATVPVSEGFARLTLDVLAWPVDGVQRYSDQSMRFLSALTGGFLFGWGVMILCLRQWLYDLAPEPTRRTVVVGLLAWFFLDTAGSIAAGVPSNAAFNVLVLVLCVGPMWRAAEPN